MKTKCLFIANIILGLGCLSSCSGSAGKADSEIVQGPLGQIDQQIKDLEETKSRYEGQAYYEDDEAMRLQTNNSDWLDARQDMKLADKNRAKAAALKEEIEQLKKKRAEMAGTKSN